MEKTAHEKHLENWYKPSALPDQRSQGPVLIRPETTNLTKHSNKAKNKKYHYKF
jgi:hypothetical protein